MKNGWKIDFFRQKILSYVIRDFYPFFFSSLTLGSVSGNMTQPKKKSFKLEKNVYYKVKVDIKFHFDKYYLFIGKLN